jgi:hypothetical protein
MHENATMKHYLKTNNIFMQLFILQKQKIGRQNRSCLGGWYLREGGELPRKGVGG